MVLEREGIRMIKVNLFDPWAPSIYGTATWQDTVTVCGASLAFCTVVVLIVFGVVKLLLV